MVGIIWILKLYFIFTVVVMVIYGIRHYIFTYNRLYYPQRKYCQDILDTDVFSVSVVIPMHNEECICQEKVDTNKNETQNPDSVLN